LSNPLPSILPSSAAPEPGPDSAPGSPAPSRRGILFVISGPSGAGKSTLLEKLRKNPDFIYSISCTTRKPRPGEVDGVDYHFMTIPQFEAKLAENGFLEHAFVHGNYYGTLGAMVIGNLERGVDVLMDVDVQGADMIRAYRDGSLRDSLVDIFITTSSLEELRARLLNRGTETPEVLNLRLANAAIEMRKWSDYRYTILAITPEQTCEDFRAIMRAERCASSRLNLQFQP
jgi:guanylate kinase